MSYRDDSEGLRARVAQLEEDLAEARAVISRLDAAGTEGSGLGALLAGGPTVLLAERTIEAELAEDHLDELADALALRFGAAGQTSVLKRRFTWTTAGAQTARMVEVTVLRRDGRTRVRVQERLGPLVGGVFGGIGGGLGGGGVGLVMLGFRYLGVALGMVGVLAWFALVVALARGIYGAIARRRARQIELAADELAGIVRQHTRRARVATGDGPDATAEAEAEQEAEAVGQGASLCEGGSAAARASSGRSTIDGD